MEPSAISYQQAMQQLEQLIEHLNRGETDIDELVVAVRDATRLIKDCRQRLHTAEGEIESALADIGQW